MASRARGLNDYDAIFDILAKHNYSGWISIEDGMNGMEEMANRWHSSAA
jgi:sugar phosphate isomerase/epimerase